MVNKIALKIFRSTTESMEDSANVHGKKVPLAFSLWVTEHH